MDIVVYQENALLGPEGQLACVVGAQVRPVGTPEHTKHGVVGCFVKESFKRCLIVNDFTRESIDEICGSDKGFVPKLKWHGGMRE